MTNIDEMLRNAAHETIGMMDEDAGLPVKTLVPSPKPVEMQRILEQCLSADVLLNYMPGVC